MEGNVSVVLKKHGELSSDETDHKRVNIFMDTTQITKYGSILNTVIMKHKEQS